MLSATYLDIAHAAAELTVTVGIIEASMDAGAVQWPDEVKGNFADKVELLYDNLQAELGEFIEFGRALDEQDDDEDEDS